MASQLLIMADDTKYEHVFIELNENTSVNDLIKEGVKPECVFGNVITAKVPKSKMGKISAKSIAPARLLKLCTDSARSQAKVDMLHPGVDRPEGYTGKGVVMGMIDCGIDLNHIEFKDEQGNCRIKRAYMPADDTHRGHTPVIDGIELPGQEYITPEEIEMAGTDSKTDFHGTFTSSIAAGSFMGNKYYGVAPEADLVVCGMPSNYLTDVNVMNSIKYIFNYAEEVGKPAVINFSLGSYDGPHEGT